jgi:hypothetical protein
MAQWRAGEGEGREVGVRWRMKAKGNVGWNSVLLVSRKLARVQIRILHYPRPVQKCRNNQYHQINKYLYRVTSPLMTAVYYVVVSRRMNTT